MTLVGAAHDRFVLGRRFRRLKTLLAPLLPRDAHVVDVGTGDGLLAAALMAERSDCRIEGLDVLVRPTTAIPVREFDGTRLPMADRSADAVLFVDVLHHTDDPRLLLREAARVARRCVIIKDHVREGFAAGPTLRLMDWAGNAHHGVRLPYNYLNRAEWGRGFADAGLEVRAWQRELGLYPAPVSWICGRGLHMITVLAPAHAGA